MEGWVFIPFESAVQKVTYTKKIPRKQFLTDGAYPIISQESDFINGYWDNSEDVFSVDSPVVVFGDHTKIIKHIDFDFVLGADGVKILKPIETLSSKFFAYFLNAAPVADLGYARHYRLLKEITVPVPPREEQERIVAILDETFADIEQVRAKTEQNLKNARELFESYLQQVFSQRGEGWENMTLSQATGGVYTGPFGSLLHKSDYIENGIPLVNPAHITSVGIEPDLRKTISEETAQRLKSYVMSEGDIVIARRGEMGRCALVTSKEEGYLCGTGSFFIKFSDKVLGDYLVRYLRSAAGKERLEQIASGAVMLNLSNAELSNFSLYFPPVDKQKKIVREIGEISEKIEVMAQVYQDKLLALDELKKSILQKAFSGELTKTSDNKTKQGALA